MPGNSLFIPLPLSRRNWSVRDIFSLIKGHLSLYIALTAMAGHALAQNRLTAESLGLAGWVLLLSCGAGVLNNIQDRVHDRTRQRTRNRILARGDLGAGTALILSAGFILSALGGLWIFFDSFAVPVLGAGAVLMYNGIYTPLKHRSVRARFWAMVPGTVCGMIPPAMGWAAVAREASVTDLSGLCILTAGLGVWQYPHFLLVFFKERADTHSGEELTQVFIWSCLFSAGIVLFLLKGWILSPLLSTLAFGVAMGLPLFLAGLFLRAGRYGRCSLRGGRHLDLGFWSLNLSMLAYMVLILLDRI